MEKPEMKKLTAEDIETKSLDVVAGNIEHLKTLFPEAFKEGKVDFDVLKQVLGGAVDEREEKYGLNWHGKRRARQLALSASSGTLRPCPEDSVDWDTTRNLMIEGDNLEVLKLLQKSYAGKVKLIYIDPPYNTGKDFVYPDNFGLDLTVPIEESIITGKTVHSIGAGTLLVCLAAKIAAAEVEPLALGIVAWQKVLAPAGETSIVFRDSAFADDVAKTNLTAILQQHALGNVRSL